MGKKRLARLLGRRLNARLLLEEPEENPFLPLFYEAPDQYGFQTQVFFMLSRYRQQQELHQMDLFEEAVVSNFIFEKDRIYANVTLNDTEFALYERLAATLSEKLPRPDLVIYLQTTVNHLMRGIRRHERGYEREITKEYVAQLLEAYNHFFFHYSITPLLAVNVSEVDFENRPEHLEAVLKTRTAFEKLSNQPPDASKNAPYHRYIHPICLIFYFCFRAYNNFKTAS